MQILSKQKNKVGQTGFSLVEVLIACAVISVSIFALMSASTQGIQLSREALQQVQAGSILEEGAEAVKSIRDTNVSGTDSGWANIGGLTLDTNYYLTFNTSTNVWLLSTTPTSAIDSLFTRVITFSAVNRDANDDITSSGGTLDVKTKKVTVTVTWPRSDNTTTSKNLGFYISDIFD